MTACHICVAYYDQLKYEYYIQNLTPKKYLEKSIKDKPNDNGPNLKLKRYYSLSKVKWQIQHGTMQFTAAHMNSVLVEMCHLFQQKYTYVVSLSLTGLCAPQAYS